MSSITITKLYALLVPKLGRETSENLTNFIEEKIKSEMESNTHILATKEDIASLAADIATLAATTKAGIAENTAVLRKEMAENKVDTIKWMFLFCVGQVAVIFGFILLFLKK